MPTKLKFSMCLIRFVCFSAGKVGKEKDPAPEIKPLPLIASASGWTCEVCMIQNDESDSSCVACTTPKPNSAPKRPLPVQRNMGRDGDVSLVPKNASCGTSKVTSSNELSKDKPAFSFGVTSAGSASSANTEKVPGFGSKTAVSDVVSIKAFGTSSVKTTETR